MKKDDLKKRKSELKELVHAEVLRREVMQFRLEPDNIEKLYQIALTKRKPVGTLLREWIVERITLELGTEPIHQSGELDKAIAALKYDLQKPLDEINQRMTVFEEIIDNWQSQNENKTNRGKRKETT